MTLKTWIKAGVLAMCAGPLWAQDAALVVGNRDYQRGDRVANADTVFDAMFALRGAGFEVASGRDTDKADLDDLIDAFVTASDDAERVVILLAGHLVEARRDTYFLPTDARAGTAARLQRSAVSLGTLLDVAAAKPGGAIVALATDPGADFTVGRNLTHGLGDMTVPQGVTLATGSPEALSLFVESLVEQPGLSIAQAAFSAGPEVTIQGYQSALHGFMPSEAVAVDPAGLVEEGWWQAAQAIGTADSIQAYLNTYPRGAFRAEARDALRDLRDAPRRAAEEAERALRLSRDDRRALQRNLTLIGYDTRGIDGIFGRGTRTAISNWQGANGIDVTGYFTRASIRVLSRQAQDRNAELEAEAADQARAESRREENLWRRATRRDTVELYRTYLARYPDGAYVREAERRLRQLDRQARREAREAERNLWDQVTVNGSAAAFQGYLNQYPDGVFADDARAQLAALEQAQADQAAIQAAANEEAQTIGNPIMRLLTERRLDGLGLEPGVVDGHFDDNTRRAIRRYQRARGLPVTGYVTQETAVRMLAEAVR